MYERLQKLGESSEVVNQIYGRLEPETQMLLPKKSSLTRWVNEIPGVKTHTAQNNSSAFGLYVLKVSKMKMDGHGSENYGYLDPGPVILSVTDKEESRGSRSVNGQSLKLEV